jgi:1,6-anhydro-N-acetylmuramate kinase
LRPLRDRTATGIAAVIMQIIADFGPPRLIQSDGEGAFVSELVRTMLERYACNHRTIAAYNPKSAGKVERHVGSVSKTLRKMMNDAGHSHWVSLLPLVQMAINKQHRPLTNSSPFALMFNRTMNKFKSYDSV